MTPVSPHRPLPLGELLEQLRREGFVVTPEVYDRCFRIADTWFPDGLTTTGQLRELKELLGPVVVRSDIEQERFGAIFDQVVRFSDQAAKQTETAEKPADSQKPLMPDRLRWATLLAAITLLLIGLVVYYLQKPVNPGIEPPQTPSNSTQSPGVDTTKRIDPSPVVRPSSYPSFPLIQANPTRITTYTRQTGYLLLAVLLATVAAAAVLFRYFFPSRKRLPSDGPPYFLTFPDQEKTIKVAESMDVWARQLNQRDEGQRRMMDVARTIRATASRGGYPSIYYQQIKLRPRYLVLIDQRSTFHQQARLYAYLGSVLTESEVELETLFFNSDPRTCRSEKYPRGIALSDLYRLHRHSYLVLITEGIRLIDYDRGTVAPWVMNGFDGWEKRAILTPVYPENWTSIEAILARFFIVLPATPDGQLLLRTYFQAGEHPTFQELRRQLQVNSTTAADRGFFGKPASKLTIAEIDRFLENPFDTEKPTEEEITRLKQWAYATAVYATPTWEMTLAIGKTIERFQGTDAFVTTTNLLKITALPWLQQSSIPEPLRQELLARFDALPTAMKTAIHQDVLQLLESVRTKPGSLAEEERERHTYEVMLTDEKHRLEALRKLAPFQKAGLITSPTVDRQVGAHERRKTVAYGLTLAILAVFGLVAGYFIFPETSPTTPAGLKRFFYTTSDSLRADSAMMYNNLAARLSFDSLKNTDFATQIATAVKTIGYKPANDSIGATYQNGLHRITSRYQSPTGKRSDGFQAVSEMTAEIEAHQKTYLPVLESELYSMQIALLMASLRQRNTFEALYNLHAVRFQRGVFLDSTGNNSSRERDLAIRGIRKIVAPTSWYSAPGFFPQDSLLVDYLNLLNQNLQADSLLIRVDALDSYGANMRKYSNPAYAQDRSNRQIQEIKTAQQAAQFNRVNLFLPNAPRNKNLLVVRVPRRTLSPERSDSLARLTAAWIKLHLDKPDSAPPTIPATAVKTAPVKAPSVKTRPKTIPAKTAPTKASNQTPAQTNSYPTQTKPATDERPATSSPDPEPAAVSPIDNTANADVKQEPQPTVVQRGIPGDYGVLVGEVRETRMVSNNLFLLIAANGDYYQVRIGNQPNASYGKSSDTPILAMAENERVRKIPGFQRFSSAKEGFYKLDKTSTSGALDYLRTGDSYADFKVDRKAYLGGLVSVSKKSPTRIYVWGARWQPASSTNPFKLPNGFYEIHYVHQNQGFYSPNDVLNAPWQDGGIILDSGSLKAIAIRFSSQSTTTDAKGDPVKATAK
ncbi:DUF2278 family protein [Larkinella punicea]|uniref:DUF2278 family protein n=1 Tax=Larkinella punicea TaxID=2315727 RepID=A0A368JMU8_9BACT|nr:DUF2278 family protein [Larkinella punicea]RCR68988.1 DUF2278 family protein [Larkinella punicea]